MDKIKRLNQRIKKLGINRVARFAGLNKSTLSRYTQKEREYSFVNFEKIQRAVNIIESKELVGRTSAREATIRVAMGEEWRIPYFDFVDSLVATKSELLVNAPPIAGLDLRSLALICSIVMQLCYELKIPSPEWARASLALEQPWFLSKFENLRALSLAHSPVFFKRNNIFVGSDFLLRA